MSIRFCFFIYICVCVWYVGIGKKREGKREHRVLYMGTLLRQYLEGISNYAYAMLSEPDPVGAGLGWV